MADVEIALFVPADRAAGWEECFAGYCAFYESPFSEELADRVFRILTDPVANLKCLVARTIASGRVVGIAHYRSAPSSLDARNTTFLDDLFTLSAMRGKGVGRMLIERVYRIAEEHDELPLQWLTAESNTPAQALYDKLAVRTSWAPYGIRFETTSDSSSSGAQPDMNLPDGFSLISCEDLTYDDEASWTAIFSHYAAFYECEVNERKLATTFGWFMEPKNVVRGLFVKSGEGSIVALCHFRPRLRSMTGGPVGYLDDLFVEPSLRGKGLADVLLHQMFCYCRKQGWPRAHWITAASNEHGQRLYERCGAQRQKFILYEMQ